MDHGNKNSFRSTEFSDSEIYLFGKFLSNFKRRRTQGPDEYIFPLNQVGAGLLQLKFYFNCAAATQNLGWAFMMQPLVRATRCAIYGIGFIDGIE